MTNNLSISAAIINTYGAENLKGSLANLYYQEQQKVISKLLWRDSPNLRRAMTWGSLSNVTNHVLTKLGLPKA